MLQIHLCCISFNNLVILRAVTLVKPSLVSECASASTTVFGATDLKLAKISTKLVQDFVTYIDGMRPDIVLLEIEGNYMFLIQNIDLTITSSWRLARCISIVMES